jgi:hypothetical protein
MSKLEIGDLKEYIKMMKGLLECGYLNEYSSQYPQSLLKGKSDNCPVTFGCVSVIFYPVVAKVV